MSSAERQRGSLSLRIPPLAASLRFRYLQNHLDQEAPGTCLYYIDNLYRQELPQKGRLRQFNKFGVEAIGSPHPEQDVEIIALAYDLCNLFEPKGLSVRLNTIGSPELRASGYTVVMETLRRSAKAQLREANRSGARAAVILGEDEVKKGTCTVKRMGTGEQEEVPHDKLAEHLDAILHPWPESS